MSTTIQKPINPLGHLNPINNDQQKSIQIKQKINKDLMFDNRIGSINPNKYVPQGLDYNNQQEEETLKQNFYLHIPNQEKPSKTDSSLEQMSEILALKKNQQELSEQLKKQKKENKLNISKTLEQKMIQVHPPAQILETQTFTLKEQMDNMQKLTLELERRKTLQSETTAQIQQAIQKEKTTHDAEKQQIEQQFQHKINAIQLKLFQAQQQSKELEIKLAYLQPELLNNQKNVKQGAQKLSYWQDEYSKLDKTVVQLQTKIELLQSQLDNSEEMSRKKDIMMESVKKEKDSLTKEIQELRIQIGKKDSDINIWRQKCDRAEHQQQAIQLQSKSEQAELKRSIKDLNDTISQMKKTIEIFESKSKKAKKYKLEYKLLEKQVELLKKNPTVLIDGQEVMHLRTIIEKLEGENQRYLSDLQKQSAMIEKLQKQCDLYHQDNIKLEASNNEKDFRIQKEYEINIKISDDLNKIQLNMDQKNLEISKYLSVLVQRNEELELAVQQDVINRVFSKNVLNNNLNQQLNQPNNNRIINNIQYRQSNY